jgi:hypothetical protein
LDVVFVVGGLDEDGLEVFHLQYVSWCAIAVSHLDHAPHC